ncbi:transposase [Bradyrhizobium sp. USDA 4454]
MHHLARSPSFRPKRPSRGKGSSIDEEIIVSLPGVKRIVLAALLKEVFDALQQRHYAALRCSTGVAPVTERSGKSCLGLTGGSALFIFISAQ